MNWYIDLVKTYPLITAMIQFALLGTAGEVISKYLIFRRIKGLFNTKIILLKMVEWAVLAVCIKYAFVGFQGFIDNLTALNFLPSLNKLGNAFAVSAAMNLQFGPFLVIMHRIMDNMIEGSSSWKNIDKGLLSLLWFWIPAHTITFILPKEYQIGLAALWSLALGIILGFYNRRKEPEMKSAAAEGVKVS